MKNFFVLILIILSFLFILKYRKENFLKKSHKVKVGFLLKTMQEERYIKDKKYFEEAAKKYKMEVIFDSANNNERLQMEKLENMIAKGIDVLVLQPVNTGTASNMVEIAHKEGIRVVGYDSMIENSDVDVHVMQDSWKVGELQAKAMVKWFKEYRGEVKGNVALIMGQPGDSNAKAMSEGVLKVIAQNPGLKLVAKQSHENWASDKAMTTTENLMAKFNNNIDAFICNNSGLARGVIAALASYNLDSVGKIFVAGADADLVNVRYVAEGKQAIEIYKTIKPLAEKAAYAAYRLVVYKDKTNIDEILLYDRKVYNGYKSVPTIITPIYEVNKNNIDEVIIKNGFHKREDIYN
ncbi:xylose-binding protein [Hypnocyclicus thermotrophus]|uniref:Xylose-binding protein n=1 Tax=Hypnocyclicus thermotrophus TaxID=1627895 RepID=A0AA46DX92_9FUSO|nr:substrate-binding domain-containing protein [Hypnocyclicus thermotrophus]TDT67902.1 xylose-binding protein [Hypnocyclicus thermotrophus]